jgi:signal transduction histidine kinase
MSRTGNDIFLLSSVPMWPFQPRMNTIQTSLAVRFSMWIDRGQKWVAILMLLSLYAALALDVQSALVRSMLLVHFGLFLLWQPFLRADRNLDLPTALLIFLPGAALLLSLSGWVIVIWLAVLIAIMGGRVFMADIRGQRFFYLVALLYLLILLLIWTVPRLIAEKPGLVEQVAPLVRVVLPVLLLLLSLLKFERGEPENTRVIDFFYSLLLFQLVVLLVLGSMTMMRYINDQYFLALFISVLLGAGALLVLAILWNPPAGFGGLRAYFSRYLLSVGLPSEMWLRRLAEIAQKELSPDKFLDSTMTEVAHLPWVVGGEWQAPDGAGRFGRRSEHSGDFSAQSLKLVIYSAYGLGPSITLHMRLLAQLLAEFYESKRREETLRLNAYMQAVHETGARVTHDVKNLLQSLYTLASAGQEQASGSNAAYTRMLKRQLPELTRRLQLTLDKLRAPVSRESTLRMPAQRWWDELRLRYEGRDIVFHADIDGSIMLPVNLFDAVADNCIENALRKRVRDPNILIEVRLQTNPCLSLAVRDTGLPVAGQTAGELFQRPIEGGEGTGIGLYQAYRQANEYGFDLRLTGNDVGHVEFTLKTREPEQLYARGAIPGA